MTETVKSRSAAVHYGLSLAKRNMKFGIMALVMNFLGLPLFLISVFADINRLKAAKPEAFTDNNTHYIKSVFGSADTIYLVIAVICTFAAVMTGVLIAMSSFSHLYDKQRVDMDFSLPMTADKRFFAGYLSGLAVYIIPYILCQIISLILLQVGRLTVDTKIGGVQEKIFENFAPLCIKLIIGGLVVMVMFYTLFVLTMCFCGSKFETAAYGIGANFCLPVLYYAYDWLISYKSYGLVVGNTENTFINHLFTCTSPIGAVCGLYLTISAQTEKILFPDNIPLAADTDFFSVESFGFWAIKCIIVTVLFMLCAFMLYRRRKAEQTGRTFISKTFRYFVMVCLMIVLSIIVSDNSTGIIPTIIVTAAAFIIPDCISNRGMSRLKGSVIKYAVIMAAVIGVYLITDKTGFFGAEKYVPDVNEIESVELPLYCGYYDIENMEGTYHFEDEENIRMITEAHAEQLNVYRSDDNADSVNVTLWIRYDMKDGRTVNRKYNSTYYSAYEKLLPLDVSAEMKEQKLTALENTVKDIGLRIWTEDIEKYPNSNTSSAPDNFSEKLMECLTEDINAMTLEDFMGHGTGNDILYLGAVYRENVSCEPTEEPYYSKFELTGEYRRTLEYLEQLGFDGSAKSYSAADISELSYIEICKLSGGYKIPVNLNWCSSETAAVINNYNYYDDRPEVNTMQISDLTETELDRLAEILSEAAVYYIPEGECYTICLDYGTHMYIPEKYNDIIESIISQKGETII